MFLCKTVYLGANDAGAGLQREHCAYKRFRLTLTLHHGRYLDHRVFVGFRENSCCERINLMVKLCIHFKSNMTRLPQRIAHYWLEFEWSYKKYFKRKTFSSCTLDVKAQDSEWCDPLPLSLCGMTYQICPSHIYLILTQGNLKDKYSRRKVMYIVCKGTKAKMNC